MSDRLELGTLEERRPALLQNQFDLALEFYAIEGDTDHTRRAHREISQQMALNAIDLVLPHVVRNMRERGLNRIALVAPLRGALALVTSETEEYLKNRLTELGLEDYDIELWAQGIKRHPEEDSAEVYYAIGYMDGNQEDTHVIILDWGTATGLTNDYGAHHIHEHGGVPFAQMTSLSMALADKGKKRLLERCVDEDDGTIHMEAATHARLNEMDYIDALAPGYGGNFQNVPPKDWGARMWGMEIEGDTDEERYTQIEDFLTQFEYTFHHIIDERDIKFLREYYQSKYLTANYTQ